MRVSCTTTCRTRRDERLGITRERRSSGPAEDRDLVRSARRRTRSSARQRHALVVAEPRQSGRRARRRRHGDIDIAARRSSGSARAPLRPGRAPRREERPRGCGRHTAASHGSAPYDPRVQNYAITELDSGERVITERVSSTSARSRSATGSAPARATRRDAKAGVSHFIEHLLFKGSRALQRAARSPRSSTGSAAS